MDNVGATLAVALQAARYVFWLRAGLAPALQATTSIQHSHTLRHDNHNRLFYRFAGLRGQEQAGPPVSMAHCTVAGN